MNLRRIAALLASFVWTAAAHAGAGAAWTPQTLAQLRQWVAAAPQDALPVLPTAPLDQPPAGIGGGVDAAATALALKLARMHLFGATPAEARGRWTFGGDEALNLNVRLEESLRQGQLDPFFSALRPRHPDYARLRAAYAVETRPAAKSALALNMERWRWLPLDLGGRFLLVNAASFTVTLWRGGEPIKAWPVIVGKPATPTPVFAATVTGVTFNPWWEIPASIVRESVGALARRNPREARRRGYVWGGGRYRQRPGPGNALGQMKLVMPNPYNVYLHDTPGKSLFAKPVRAFSHGCIRVGNAIDLAATLLGGAETQAAVDSDIASGNTVTRPLAAPIPIYIAYFTAGSDADGKLAQFPDIYGRDAASARSAAPATVCPG